jgi:hypothetical protein
MNFFLYKVAVRDQLINRTREAAIASKIVLKNYDFVMDCFTSNTKPAEVAEYLELQ